jgi:glycosyltransferase involved in cell wall biosynthesis
MSALNEGRRLLETISSVATADVKPSEIIVVDDGSTDGCTDTIETSSDDVPSVRVFRRPHEGIARARDFGASVSTEPLLIFLDAHCSVDARWLEPLVEKIGYNANSIAVPSIANTGRPSDRGCGARLINDLLSYQWMTQQPPPVKAGVAPGGCFALQRNTLQELGGFAAMRDFGVEDVELSLRAWRFGCPILTVPESLILHDFRKQSPYPMHVESWLANVLLTALLHFDGERIKQTLNAAGGFAPFSQAITSVLSSNWMERKAWIDARSVRPLRDYWQIYPQTG